MKTHKRHARLFCSLLLASAMLFCGCAEYGNAGNAKTIPIEHILNALSSGSAAEYEAAFPPDFCMQYHETFPSVSETVSLLLTTAHAVNCDLYGENYRIRYELSEQEEIDFSGWENPFSFHRLDNLSYTLPLEQITQAAELRVRIDREGSYGEEREELILTVLCIGESWYLHPQHFGTVLRDERNLTMP